MFTPLSKLEIDVNKNEQLDEAAELAKRCYCPALVVSPDLVATATLVRGIRQGRFKVITAIDWPKGEQYCREKFRGIPIESLQSDGFEIILTPRDNLSQIATEIKYISGFVREQFNQLFELRFVLDIDQSNRTDSIISHMLETCKQIPLPFLIRTTHNTKISPQVKIASHLETIKNTLAVQVKVSGNVDFNIYTNVKAERFAATLQQAQSIVKEMQNIGKVAPPKIGE